MIAANWPAGARALSIGEALVDIVHDRAGGVAEHPGGSPLNVAVGLARLGADVELAACLGDDERGAMVRRHAEASGVTLSRGTLGAIARTSTAQATLAADGGASYEFALEWRPARPDVTGFDVVHTGSIAAYLEPGATTVLEAVEAAASAALVSFDANVRPTLIGPRAGALARVAAFARVAQLVKMSDEDAAWLYPGRSAEQSAAALAAETGAVAIITRGAAGGLLATDTGVHEFPAFPVATVDTVGAGDSFMAGFLFAVVVGGLAPALRRRTADAEPLLDAARFAAACAAITASRAGADLPSAEEVAAFLGR
ncbi:PfkB family carbohydrate kinase [Agromyces mediolanus]|uniref:PfkB family carbohydrate kinase n=1 Tax=Agromyces mediolanus TaxID=41986 RepID=UPI00383488AC